MKQVTIGHDPRVTEMACGHPVMVFDGACNLCHGWVKFALGRDPAGHLRFLAIQSPAGQGFLARNGLPAQSYESFYLVEGGAILQKSHGFLRMVRYLRAPWPWLGVFNILPAWLLDPLYDLIARNRYRWFGRRELCLVPELGVPERFLT
ncbi:MAG TPA: DCC1-like thiol-disulfide oxidoreductase family protein [Dongiaceae bacterium]|nr:DCC1-like thiol-disulfide oxidoreductase family protein [Dongiaceae bacterium]